MKRKLLSAMCGCVLIHLTSQHALHYLGNSSLDKLVTPDPVYPHSNQQLNADRKKQKPFSHPTPTMISHTRAGTAAVQILRSGSQQKSQEQNLPHSKKKKKQWIWAHSLFQCHWHCGENMERGSKWWGLRERNKSLCLSRDPDQIKCQIHTSNQPK